MARLREVRVVSKRRGSFRGSTDGRTTPERKEGPGDTSIIVVYRDENGSSV